MGILEAAYPNAEACATTSCTGVTVAMYGRGTVVHHSTHTVDMRCIESLRYPLGKERGGNACCRPVCDSNNW